MYGRAEGVVGEIVAAGLDDRTRRRMQVHNLVDAKTQLATFRKMTEAGRVRYVGVSHWVASAHAELEKTLREEDLDFVQLNYSIAGSIPAASTIATLRHLGQATIPCSGLQT